MSLHQCFLIVFTLILSSEGQAGEIWESLDKAMLFQTSWWGRGALESTELSLVSQGRILYRWPHCYILSLKNWKVVWLMTKTETWNKLICYLYPNLDNRDRSSNSNQVCLPIECFDTSVISVSWGFVLALLLCRLVPLSTERVISYVLSDTKLLSDFALMK